MMINPVIVCLVGLSVYERWRCQVTAVTMCRTSLEALALNANGGARSTAKGVRIQNIFKFWSVLVGN
ncbi:MAG: hypothetical protein V7K20_18090 [Nostoc sp.]